MLIDTYVHINIHTDFGKTEGPAINVVQRKIVEVTTRGTTSDEIYVYDDYVINYTTQYKTCI